MMVGSQYGIHSEYYRPLSGTSSWFVAPRAGFDSSLYPVFNESTLLTIYREREALGGLDFGYAFGSTGELRLGYERLQETETADWAHRCPSDRFRRHRRHCYSTPDNLE
jgi:NTE family protein